jgi:nucleoid-associated protein YgaU
MEKNPSGPWASRFKFVPPDSSDQDPARYYRRGGNAPNANSNQEASEAELARTVASAYNGGDKFLDSEDPQKTKPNSWIHGKNAGAIARDLVRFNLFRSPVADTRQRRVAPKVTRHIVVASDTLSKLAQTYYKDVNLWPIIYAVNQATCGPDPNKLAIGQELVIPDISSMKPAQIEEAKRRAKQLHPSATVPVEPLR